MFFKKRQPKENRHSTVMRRLGEQDEYSFRRSRTLTGTTSSHIKASSAEQAQLKSPRIKAHELRRHRRKLGLALVGTIIVCLVLFWLLTQFMARISVAVFLPPTVSSPRQQVYAETIQSYLGARPFERFQFALNSEGLLRYVQLEHPEIKQLAIHESSSVGSGAFTATLRQPILGWKVNNKQYYVDGDGAPFTQNYYRPPAVTVQDDSGIAPDKNTGQLASNRFLSFLGRVVELTHRSGVGDVEKVTIPAGIGSRSIEVRLKGREYPIRMYVDRDPAAQVEDMRQAIAYFDKQARKPHYIDVRIKGRAYYRE